MPSPIRPVVAAALFVLPCLLGATAGRAEAGATFGPELVIDPLGSNLRDLHVADLDGDGDLDLVACRLGSPPLVRYENLGGGTFGPPQALPNPPTSALRARSLDYDQDGDLDLIVAADWYTPSLGSDYRIARYRNVGNGTFQGDVAPSVGGDATGLSIADVEGDGDLDLFYSSDSPKISVELGAPGAFGGFSGGFLATDQAIGVRDLIPADLDGDGDADLVAASYASDEVAWFENTAGTGAFGPKRVLNAQADGALAVDVADVDGDGDLDVLSASSLGWDKEVHWYENLGGGAFGPTRLVATENHPGIDVRTFDPDLDGDLDVLVADGTGASWYENDGAGGFGSRRTVGAPTSLGQVAEPADLDGDGFPDVVVAHAGGVSWFRQVPPPPWHDLGSGLAGGGGVPLLAGSGSLQVGSPGAVTLTSAASLSPALLLHSFTSTPTPFACGTLVPVPVHWSLPFVTDAAGGVALAWTAWPPELNGQSFHLQIAVSDPAAVCGVALSNALRADLPP
ncbi:MAG: FG-GAP repeat domain-containing protein [Planctomycetota bacterium JB042]